MSLDPSSHEGATPAPPAPRAALWAGALAALLASACCLGPLVLITLGLSGAWIANQAGLEPWRPLFLAAALLALLLAGRSLHGAPAAAPLPVVVRRGGPHGAARLGLALPRPAVLLKGDLMKQQLALAALLAGSAAAASRTVTLAVPSMNCAVCSITVRKALSQVPGLSRAVVDYGRREAVVTFDDARTSVEALMDATADAGYPSRPAGGAR